MRQWNFKQVGEKKCQVYQHQGEKSNQEGLVLVQCTGALDGSFALIRKVEEKGGEGGVSK